MKTKVREQYYYKNLYFSAGRNLIKSNFEYYCENTSQSRIESACRTIISLSDNSRAILLKDTAGCCTDAAIKELIPFYSKDGDIYTYSDDKSADIRLNAVYICCNDVFICGCSKTAGSCNPVVDLHGCYKSQNMSIRGYPAQTIVDVAQFFFDKSSTCCLCGDDSQY